MATRAPERFIASLPEDSCTMKLAFGGETRAGTQGEPNQDCIRIVQPDSPPDSAKGTLFVLADGLGGYANGEVASKLICDELPRLYYQSPAASSRERLHEAVSQANEIVFNAAQEYRGMCTTLVAALVRGKSLVVGHVGDSKCFLIRDEKVWFATADHSVWISAFDGSGQRYLTRTVGARKDLVPSVSELSLRPGDVIVLCSDGLTDALTPAEIIAGVMTDDPGSAASDLVALAAQRGATDDVSVIVVKFGE